MAYMLMNQRRCRGLYGCGESGAVGPLEASRGAEVDWASIWRTLIVVNRQLTPHGGIETPAERINTGVAATG